MRPTCDIPECKNQAAAWLDGVFTCELHAPAEVVIKR